MVLGKNREQRTAGYQRVLGAYLALITALIAVFGVLRTMETNAATLHEQLRAEERSRLNERYQAASAQLGNDSSAVRAWAMTALASIADDWQAYFSGATFNTEGGNAGFAGITLNAGKVLFESMGLSDASFSFFDGNDYADEDVYLGVGDAMGARFDTIPSFAGTVFGIGMCVNEDSSQPEPCQTNIALTQFGSAKSLEAGFGTALVAAGRDVIVGEDAFQAGLVGVDGVRGDMQVVESRLGRGVPHCRWASRPAPAPRPRDSPPLTLPSRLRVLERVSAEYTRQPHASEATGPSLHDPARFALSACANPRASG
ncbi:MAG: hypothetical protein LBK59_06635 [Bifidobacteriaceae bacterium]|jgi:hypothetical protein|nr:hypothetical protein [Bifidobacteriaceae bacterium]